MAYPYAKGCNELGQVYLNANTSAMLFSYNGGEMMSQGFWEPKNYNQCDVNNDTIRQDVQTFDAMLTQYQQVFPHATFTIVGHSLGGLVALQGAYDYAIVHHNNVINKVITLDSPLEGVLPAQSSIWTTYSAAHCNKINANGWVTSIDLFPLGQGINTTPRSMYSSTITNLYCTRCNTVPLCGSSSNTIRHWC